MQYPWLDDTRTSIIEDVVRISTKLLQIYHKTARWPASLETAEIVLRWDPLNVVAFQEELIALARLGRIGAATQEHEKFCKQYKEIYEEEFPMTLREIVAE